MSSDLFRPIYSECEVLLLGIERGLLTQKELEEEIKKKDSLGSVVENSSCSNSTRLITHATS